jgi:uncharacterized protein Usg
MDTTRLQGWGLTTAEIMYYFDQAPRFPKLRKFLTFWSQNLDGPLATVVIAHNKMIGAREIRIAGGEWRLH